MIRHFLIWLVFAMTVAWVIVVLLPWLVVGPMRLSLRVTNRVGQILARLYDRIEAIKI
jgi:hypothetical protein